MTKTVTSRTRRVAVVAVPAIALVLLLAACGKKDEPAASQSGNQSAQNQSTTTSGGSGNQSAVATTPQGQSWDINQDIWLEGFKITLGKGSYDPKASEVKIEANLENLGKDSSTHFGTYTLVADDAEIATGSWADTKNVTGGGKTKDTLTFSGVGTSSKPFNVDKTKLLAGSGSSQQATVPLNGKGDVVSLKPVEQPKPNPIVIGEVTLTPEKFEVRYDDPQRHTQADKGKAFLVLSGKGKNANAENRLYYTDRAKALVILPNGDSETLEDDQPGSYEAGKTTDFRMVWVIPAPVKGDYKLKFTQPWGPPDGTEVTTEVAATLSSDTGSGTTSGTTKGTTK